MSNTQEISTKKGDSDLGLKFLSTIKFWRKRLKYDSWFLLSFFMIFGLVLLFLRFIVIGIEFYIRSLMYLTDLLLIVLCIFALYMGITIPKSFERLLEKNESILVDPEEYKEFVGDTFGSKIELYVPLILAIVLVVSSMSSTVRTQITSRTFMAGTETIIITDEKFIFYLLGTILNEVFLFIGALVVGSALVTLINTFRTLNKLGKKNLKISYEDLRAGRFEEIGKFVISISIPTIVLSTFVGIFGLYLVVVDNNFGAGYSSIIIGIVITIMISFLLFKNTTNIHDAISRFKDDLKHSLLKEIKEITDKKVKEDDEDTLIKQFARKLLFYKLKYKTIQSIHEYYDKIDEINDWPFNPRSIKKLVITLGSSLVPLALSFIGFG